MQKLIVLLVLIVLIGCSKAALVCENTTINNTIETIKYVNNTIIKEVNITCDETAREMELIRRLKFLENNQDKLIMNETRCIGNNSRCEDKLDMYIRDIDELEDELYNCTEQICDLNSSWC